jgi:hypothetical protein
MAVRNPLVQINGQVQELPAGDTVTGVPLGVGSSAFLSHIDYGGINTDYGSIVRTATTTFDYGNTL